MPIAKAIADKRRNPVSREMAMPVDITIVLRTNEGVESSAGGPGRAGAAGGGGGSTPPGVRSSVRSSDIRSSGPLRAQPARHEPSHPQQEEHERGADRDQQREAVVRRRTHHERL